MVSKNSKNKDFDKKMTEKILPKFASAKDWKELMSVTSNFKLNLSKYSHFNMAKLTDKAQLARRLAYTLNPALEGGVHEIAVNTYSDVFENIRRHNNNVLGEDLGLYSSGLLPFFNYASLVNKSIFLEKIVKLHFLNLTKTELMFLMPGLLASLIPGLAEQSESLLKEIKETFTIIKEKISEEKFFGCLWMVLLRTPKLRLEGIKYINECVPIYKPTFKQEELSAISSNFFPNKNTLIVNSLKAMIEDNEVLVQRNVMDFLITKIPINNKYFEEREKMAIISSTLKLLIKNEHSLSRRLFNWLLNSTEDDAEMGDPVVQYMIDLLVKSIKLVFHTNDHKFGMSVLDLLFKHQAKFIDYILPEISWELLTSLYHNRRSKEILEKAKKFFSFDGYYLEIIWKALARASNPINVYQRDLMEFHTKITEELEKQIMIIKSSFLEKHREGKDFSRKKKKEKGSDSKLNTYKDNNIKKEVKDPIGDYNDNENIVLNNNNKGFGAFNNNDNNNNNNNFINNNNNNINSKQANLQSNLITSSILTYNINNIEEEMLQRMQIIPFIIQFCLEEFFIVNLEDKYNLYLPLISNLLFHLANEKIKHIDEIRKIKNLLGITLNLMIDMHLEEEKAAVALLSGKKVNRYSKVRDNIKEQAEQNIKLYEKFYIQIINYLLVTSNSKIDDEKLRLFQNATELVIKVQIYKEREHTPEWLIYLIKLIFTTKNVWLSLEALEFILDVLNMKNENDQIREIKLFLRQESLEYVLDSANNLFLQGLDNNSELTKKYKEDTEIAMTKILGYLNDFRSNNPIHRSRNSLEFAMAKLWKLIPDQSVQKKVTDLLIKFSMSDPDLFGNAVSSTLNSTDLEEMVEGINTFSQFWKLTSEHYPEKRFFERGECTFKILDFLDHPHPLIRHVSKSWLSQTTSQFNKVLDPLLLVLLDPETKYYLTPGKQLVITDVYDSKRIVDAFRKLKNIIVNFSEYDKVIKYCTVTPPSKSILELCEFTEKTQKHGALDYLLETYVDLLVHVSMRFIQGKFIETVNKDFHKEHFSVKAASCEFLEYLMINVEDKSKVMRIASIITEPILAILMENIIQEEVVMQVQLLNLLKALFFSTESVHLEPENTEISQRIFSCKLLHNCLNLGLAIDFIFVRTHFMSFLEGCFPILKRVLSMEENLRIGNKLLITCSAFLVKRVEYFSELNKKKIFKTDKQNQELSALNKNIEEKTLVNLTSKAQGGKGELNSSIQFNYATSKSISDNDNNNNNEKKKYFIIKNYLLEYTEIIAYDENDISTILKGIKQILVNFLDIKVTVNSYSEIKWSEVEARIKHVSFDNYSGSYFFGFLFKKTKELAESIAYNVNDSLQKEMINEVFSIYEEVFKSFLKCWISNSSSYMTKDLCLSSNGIVALDENSNINFSDQNLIGEKSSVKQAYSMAREIMVNINLNMMVISPMEYFTVLLKIWFDDDLHNQNKQNKLMMMEIITSMNIPMNVFIKCVLANVEAERITNYKKSNIKYKGNFPFIVNYNDIEYESKICHLLYAALCYTKYFEPCWPEFIDFFELFNKSKSPSTWIWIFEIMNSLVLKQPMNKLYKAKLKEIFEGLSLKLTEFALLENTDFIINMPGRVIRPIPPSIYEKVTNEVFDHDVFAVPTKKKLLMQQIDNRTVFMTEEEEEEVERQILNQMRVSLEQRESSFNDRPQKAIKNNNNQYSGFFLLGVDRKGEKNEETDKESRESTPLIQFFHYVYETVRNDTILKHEELTKFYRITAFINLKQQYYNIIRQINPPEKVDKAILHMQGIIKHLLTVLNKKVGIESIYIDLSIEFLESLFSKSNSQLAMVIKPGLLSFFFDNDFFKMSRKSLNHWMTIIRDFVQFQRGILEEMFLQFSQGYGAYFSKSESPEKVKILLLRRVSFVIYSCEKDSFDIMLILEKIKDILIQMSDNLNLEVEVFLLIRIMFLRFSTNNLTKLLGNLWPLIFSEIVTILFNKKKEFCIDLPLSCLKLIECLSLANMEEFCLYQWSMLLDTYELHLLCPTDEEYTLKKILTCKDKDFKPLVFSFVNLVDAGFADRMIAKLSQINSSNENTGNNNNNKFDVGTVLGSNQEQNNMQEIDDAPIIEKDKENLEVKVDLNNNKENEDNQNQENNKIESNTGDSMEIKAEVEDESKTTNDKAKIEEDKYFNQSDLHQSESIPKEKDKEENSNQITNTNLNGTQEETIGQEKQDLIHTDSQVDCLNSDFYKLYSYDQHLERGLILTKQTVSNKEELSESIIVLIEYIVKMNNFLPNIKWSDVEYTVESDFLRHKYH